MYWGHWQCEIEILSSGYKLKAPEVVLKNTDAEAQCRPVEAESLGEGMLRGRASGISIWKLPSFDPRKGWEPLM